MTTSVDPQLAALMTDTVTLEPYSGQNSHAEPTFGAGVQYQARVVGRTRLVRDTDGQQVVSNQTVYLATIPATLTTRDRITLPDGTQPLMMMIERVPDEHGAYYVAIYTGRGRGTGFVR